MKNTALDLRLSGRTACDDARSNQCVSCQSSRKRLVYQAMQKLSKINCEIILLKDMQGLPLEEIADMLDLPLGTVKSRSSRARVELARAVLAIDGGSNGAEAAI